MNSRDYDLLEAACRRVASITMSMMDDPKNIAEIVTSDDIDEVVIQYMKYCSEIVEDLEIMGLDSTCVVRAVDHLRRHAGPHMRKDMKWFKERFLAIIELACPELFGHDPEYCPIYTDLLHAMARANQEQTITPESQLDRNTEG